MDRKSSDKLDEIMDDIRKKYSSCLGNESFEKIVDLNKVIAFKKGSLIITENKGFLFKDPNFLETEYQPMRAYARIYEGSSYQQRD